MSCFDPGDQGGTYCGNPLACAAGLAVMQALLAEGFLEKARETGNDFQSRLRALSAHHGLGEVRGDGLLLALDLGRNIANEIVTRAREAGLLLNAPRPHLLRFMPALNSTRGEIDEGMAVLAGVLATCGEIDRA